MRYVKTIIQLLRLVKKKYCHKTTKRMRDIEKVTLRSHYENRALSSVFFPALTNGDSKYSFCPLRFLPDQSYHNANPDEEHMQLLSLNKISKFQLYPSTMAAALVCWLSSYSVGLLIVFLPLSRWSAVWVPIPQLYSNHTFHFFMIH